MIALALTCHGAAFQSWRARGNGTRTACVCEGPGPQIHLRLTRFPIPVATSCSEIQALNDETLGSRLARLSSRKGFENTYAGLVLNDTRLTAGSGGAHRPILAGCLAKLLTASLVTEAVADGHLHLSDAIDDVLPSKHPSRRKLAGVTVRHLLEHTHGLDESSLQRVPRRTDGFIDAVGLCDGLAARSIASPGALYSYGSVGGWLAGAALESVYRKRYAQLLDERDLLCPAAPGEQVPAETICPATGADLQLTGAQWLAFVHLHIRDAAAPRRSGALARSCPGGWCTSREFRFGWTRAQLTTADSRAG